MSFFAPEEVDGPGQAIMHIEKIINELSLFRPGPQAYEESPG